MTLEELISEINANGWLITDLYQRSPKGWGASLRAKNGWTEAHGTGDTHIEALSTAWEGRPRKRMKDSDWQALRNKPKPGGVPRRRLPEGTI